MIARLALFTAVLTAGMTAPAQSVSIAVRTYSMSLDVNGDVSNGASTRPALSPDGQLIAFDSTATDLAADGNGEIRDVFSRDILSNTTRLVSQRPDGRPADGPSSHAVVSNRKTVVFQSDATNLVDGDSNGVTDIFSHTTGTPLVRVSVATDGSSGNGPSTQPDVSADGHRVVFVSAASNLVPGDVNGVPDVFVRDLRSGRLRIVTRGADGASRAPSISPDGRYVTFSSAATTLVGDDTNGKPDVFIADLSSNLIELVSRATDGRQQDEAVIEPFAQVSDVTGGGRYVVFDSDAQNLVRGDRNRDTDVFLRDRRTMRTHRISVDQFGFEADNDSFNPVITGNGLFVAFQSFAERLAPGDGPREDVFIYDLRQFAPVTASVGARGERRGRETVRQLLQRPAVSANGQLVAFTSTAGNLVTGDTNGAEDVFLRVTLAPRVRIVRGPRGTVRTRRPLLVLRADDPAARSFVCNVDGVRIRCDRRTRLPRLAPGNHILRVRAGGPGMLYQNARLTRRFRVLP